MIDIRAAAVVLVNAWNQHGRILIARQVAEPAEEALAAAEL